MAAKTRNISTLIESQLPGFIVSDYEKFKKFLESYYDQLEFRGQPLDILHNLTKYRDLNFYDNNILTEKTILSANISENATTISVEDASSFPEENGYIKIGNEICFYKQRTDTEFLEVSRGVSGNNTLGDLYNQSEFVTTESQAHPVSSEVYNISNLFLYAFVRNIENEYLGSFPEKFLKKSVDKRTLIKNISEFYKAKGTDRSIKFLFSTIISRNPAEEVSVYKPKDFTYKASVSDWTSATAVRAIVLSGDVNNLIGNKITQDTEEGFASAIVDSITPAGSFSGYPAWQLTLSPGSLVGDFSISASTTLLKSIRTTDVENNRVVVYSTQGFPKQGKFLVDNNIIEYSDKNTNQFVIKSKKNLNTVHNPGSKVLSYSVINSSDVSIIIFGVVQNLLPSNPVPYSNSGDKIQFSRNTDKDNIIVFYDEENPPEYITFTGSYSVPTTRWYMTFYSSSFRPTSVPSYIHPNFGDVYKQEILNGVAAIYEDDQYVYICSSSFSGYGVLTLPNANETYYDDKPIRDQKLLKIIRKRPVTTTEVYSTGNRDVGISRLGTPFYSFRDFESINFGNIVDLSITNKGFGYKSSPYVLINEQPNKARAVLSGEVVSEIELLTNDVYDSNPEIRITSGENARLTAVVTNGSITSIKIDNPGRYYSSPPIIRIIDLLGKGNFAEYESVVSDGKIVELKKITGGKFYDPKYTKVIVEPVGSGATSKAKIKTWIKDRYVSLGKGETSFYSKNSSVFENIDKSKGYGSGIFCYTPISAYAAIDEGNFVRTDVHAPLVGYAYDGNPIYGPFAYSDPLNPNSPVVRMRSGYRLKLSRQNGPSVVTYPLGSFIDDYEWVPSVNSGKTELDQNNGRFCVTPDYPEGTYAYFMTVESDDETPAFPYILGENFYSLPVDSNYNSPISQDDLPKTASRIINAAVSFDLNQDRIDQNGSALNAVINDVTSGSISGSKVISTAEKYSVNNKIIVNDSGTGGTGVDIAVESVKGKNVVSIESKETKAVKIKTFETSYLFEGDTIFQDSPLGFGTVAFGTLIGGVQNGNEFVLREVEGNFDPSVPISSVIKVDKLILDENCTYTKGATLSLINFETEEIIATGEVLESITNQNSVIIKIISGVFIIDSDYFVKSSVLSDTSRSEIISISSLSQNLTIFEIEDNIAILETEEAHGLTKGDIINVDVTPPLDNPTYEINYYVRKKLYQSLQLGDINHNSKIVDTGVGNLGIINSGIGYISGTYNDVELIFRDSNLSRNKLGQPGDPGNARARIVVGNPFGNGFGPISSITITKKGFGYRREDILTFAEGTIVNIDPTTTQRFAAVVNHVGFSDTNSVLYLSNLDNLSIDDYIKVGPEILKITAVTPSGKFVRVLRGQKGTTPLNHFNGADVKMEESTYRFDENYGPLGSNPGQPLIKSYDNVNKNLLVTYDYGNNINQIQKITRNTVFFDQSIPAKVVSLVTVDEPRYKLEFSKDNELNFIANPSLDVQKYYGYKFDTSHFSMVDTYLDISASINLNILTQEKVVSQINPGFPGSYIFLRFGYGISISDDLPEKIDLQYSSYYYFIKASDINTDEAKLNIIDVPLSGRKEVIFNTDTRAVYRLDGEPEYDGSGVMSYTTTSLGAVGEINTLKIINGGKLYKELPTVYGAIPNAEYESIVTPVIVDGKIVSVKIEDSGKDYVNPIAVIVDTDGFGAALKCFKNENGELYNVNVLKEGSNYTYAHIKIVEADTTIYLESKNIGLPKNVTFFSNGSWFTKDLTTRPSFRSPSIFILKDVDGFNPTTKIIQPATGATADVVKWRQGGNILKVENIKGVFKNNRPIFSKFNNTSALLVEQHSTEFSQDVRSYSNNIGNFLSEKGKLSDNTQRIQDSYFYQDYSYVVESETPVNDWRELVKETTHPAGFQLFGEVNIYSDGTAPMPSESKPIETYCQLNLEVQAIDVITTRRVITSTVINFETFTIEKGVGGISITDIDPNEMRISDIILSPDFDGDLDPDTSKRIGNTVFQILDSKTKLPLIPYNDQQLFVTIDGVIQEPGVAYTTVGANIIFSEPPFGERIFEGQLVPAQNFYGKSIKFRDNTLNEEYLKKIKDISGEFDGRTQSFDLYYEDGSIVKTDQNEDLIVVIDGVKQSVGERKSYQIRRFDDLLTTDQIVFDDPPIKETLYRTDKDDSVEVQQRSFIYSIGNYFTGSIDTTLIPEKPQGPFLITNVKTQKVINVFDPLYALVFVNNILQIPGKSYNISGSVIRFTSPLPYYVDTDGNVDPPKVEILYAYGRTTERTLTIHNFENETYFRRVVLTVSGLFDKPSVDLWFADTKLIGAIDISRNIEYVSVYRRGNETTIGGLTTYELGDFVANLGELLNYRLNGSDLEIVLKSTLNWDLEEPYMIRFVKQVDGEVFGYTLDGSYTISYADVEDSEGNRLLRRNSTYWLDGSLDDKVYYERKSLLMNLQPSDKIKISGETEYRDIISIPRLAYSKQFNLGEPVDRDIYTKIQTTPYNGPESGVGLSITAKIDAEGRVIDLEWNQREFRRLYNSLVVTSTAGGYVEPPQIYFVPRTSAGGGARATVLWDKDLIAIKLLNGGYGYEEAPIVVVAKPFDIIKDPSTRKVESLSVIGLGINVNLSSLLFGSFFTLINVDLLDALSYFTGSIVSFPVDADDRVITTIIEPAESEVTFEVEEFPFYIRFSYEPPPNPPLAAVAEERFIWITDIIDSISDEDLSSAHLRTYVDFEYQKVITNTILEPRSSTSDLATILDADLLIGDTIAYVPNTRGFPYTGRIQIGYETIFYGRKEDDRFLDLIRGEYDSLISDHFAGEYVRFAPDYITVIPANPELNVESISSVEMSGSVPRNTVRTLQPVIYPKASDITKFVVTIQIDLEVDAGLSSVQSALSSGSVITVPGFVIPIFREALLISPVDTFTEITVIPFVISFENTNKLPLSIDESRERIIIPQVFTNSIVDIIDDVSRVKTLFTLADEEIFVGAVGTSFFYTAIVPAWTQINEVQSADVRDVDFHLDRYLQPLVLQDSIVSIQNILDRIRTLNYNVVFDITAENNTVSEVISIINPVENVTIAGVFTDVVGADIEVIDIDLLVRELIIETPVISVAQITFDYYKLKPITLERNASFQVEAFDALIFREGVYLRNTESIEEIRCYIEIDYPIREELGEFFAVNTFPEENPVITEFFFSRNIWTEFEELLTVTVSDDVRYNWLREIVIEIDYEVLITKEITRYYPDFHLDPITSEPRPDKGLYGIVTMTETYPIEVFFFATVPRPDDTGGTDTALIIPRNVEIVDINIQFERLISIEAVYDFNVTSQVTIYYPGRHLDPITGEPDENEGLYGIVSIAGIFTNFNDFENLPIPGFPYENPLEYVDLTNVLDVSSIDIFSNYTRELQIESAVTSTIFTDYLLTTHNITSDDSLDIDIVNDEQHINIQVFLDPEKHGENVKISENTVGAYVNYITSGIADSISTEFNNKYLRTTLGPNYTTFERNAFISNGSLNVNASMEQLLEEFVIQEFETRQNSSLSPSGTPFKYGIPTINEIGGILGADFLAGDTVLELSNNSPSTNLPAWPSSGRVLIGTELIEYTGIVGKTLTGITRGVNGTEIQNHTAGDYLRTIG